MTLRQTLPGIIRTGRLTLRAPAMADLAALVSLANNWNVVSTTAAMPFPYLEAHGREFIEGANDPQNPLAYVIAQAGVPLGVISLKFAGAGPPELGYWLGEPHWRKGYAPEAVAAIMDAVRAGGLISAVKARVLTENPASVRVLEKAGFVVVEQTTSVIERHLGKPLLIMGWSPC